MNFKNTMLKASFLYYSDAYTLDKGIIKFLLSAVRDNQNKKINISNIQKLHPIYWLNKWN